MTLTVITPPDGEALSLDAAKDYLRIGTDGEDALVTALVAAARARLEAASGLALVTRVLKQGWECWPRDVTRRGAWLGAGPVTALVSVAVVDAEETAELVTGRFRVRAGRLMLRPWMALPLVPEGGRIEAVFEAGYGVAGDVPEDLVLALKLLVLEAYRRGSAGSDLPDEVDAIVSARRGVKL
jgi:uncharacterized phiE125 gp8 family phage protein